MHKHGHLPHDGLAFYRVKVNLNQSVMKYTGSANFTPHYVYMRKTPCGKFLSEVFTFPLPSAQSKRFIRLLQTKARVKDITKNVKIGNKNKHL